MAFVVDASVALACFLPDETSASARELFARVKAEDVWAPAIWLLEIGNGLLVAEMRKRISTADRAEIIHQIAALPVSLDQPHQPIDLLSVCDIARKHALSVYDACYMQLAGSRRIPLATFDRQLRAATQRCGVPTLP